VGPAGKKGRIESADLNTDYTEKKKSHRLHGKE
jgi:hypothetical protein